MSLNEYALVRSMPRKKKNFFLFFFCRMHAYFLWEFLSAKYNFLALLWSFPFWVGLQIFIFQGYCHILILIKWHAEGSNIENISIKVFTNRVTHTRKRWAVNNNFNCQISIELESVSKTDTYLIRGRILLSFMQKEQKILLQRKIFKFLFKVLSAEIPISWRGYGRMSSSHLYYNEAWDIWPFLKTWIMVMGTHKDFLEVGIRN